jgi:hypothetical protein
MANYLITNERQLNMVVGPYRVVQDKWLLQKRDAHRRAVEQASGYDNRT